MSAAIPVNDDTSPIRLSEIEQARELLRGVTSCTPIETSTSLSAMAGVPVLLKCENLQRAGSFKLRGAFTRLSALSEAERNRGVIAASAGNHAQGVAVAARELGIDCVVFMPTGAALPKVTATRGYGAEVRLAGEDLAESIELAQDEAAASGRVFIPPFDHVDIVTGQATLGLEVLEQVPEVATIIVPTGGGGLLAGVAAAVHLSGSCARVVGVQAEGAAAFPASLAQGAPVRLTRMATIADGIAVPVPSALTLGIVREHVAEIRTVTEEQIGEAMLFLSERAKLVVEPAGAVGVAALLDGAQGLKGPVVVVLSGGNVDTLLLDRVLLHGLAAAGRFMEMIVRLPDRPGSLVKFLTALARTECNVVSVEHDRTSSGLAATDVQIGVKVETKGREHKVEIISELKRLGYDVGFPAVEKA
ncbi:threonine ammonia-lyase [Arthrobacter sp. H35-D1]|uniref:threonine ammonia-lyase n=1 Tax=Arthrobacter sp. H35-D1 TaxID=3046202 RepID=UPI0024BAA55B|nr:threonine ammonia-lyase [Arthrobacter sp. H35-D1]MDJ0313389.1 threonine ammonia-lyase [Arthrobacter sp. H35-D1]